MDLERAIYGRRTVREFTDRPVDTAQLRQLIDAAIAAPSAINQQPWHFHVVRGQAELAAMSRQIATHMQRTARAATSPHLQQLMADPQFSVLHDAPALIVIASRADSPWAVADCALAAENLMLMAFSLGLGTCWIGSAESWLASPEGRARIGLDEALRPIAPIIVGHPRHVPAPVPRRPADIHWVGADANRT